MKRSRELAPLSRDHHKALHAALVLRRANEETASDAIEAFLEFWAEHGEHHFEIEESLLLPGFAAAGGDPHDEVVTRVLTDHVDIRGRARSLAVATQLADLHELGKRLQAHVRLEEEELFPLIERTLDADSLAGLGSEIAVAEGRGSRPPK